VPLDYVAVMELSIKDELWWGADLCLSTWVEYQSRRGPYGSVDSPSPSNGSVRFIFAPEGRDLAPLNEQEVALTLWFELNEPVVSKAVKEAVIDWCSPNNIVRNKSFDFGEEFPSISSEHELRQFAGLHTVYMHQIISSGVPYLGYEFGCQWEEEHGLGVLMHGARCVEVGFADTAMMLWIAKKHEMGHGRS
jgi:hypothetical protein